MKKGDIVTIKDDSYTRSVINGELVHESLSDEGGKRYIVAETGCKFPLTEEWQSSNFRNNTVIQAFSSDNQVLSRGKVVFIHAGFLQVISFESIREVTMAEVCAEFGQDVKIRKD